jgi:hypothetical protein
VRVGECELEEEQSEGIRYEISVEIGCPFKQGLRALDPLNPRLSHVTRSASTALCLNLFALQRLHFFGFEGVGVVFL